MKIKTLLAVQRRVPNVHLKMPIPPFRYAIVLPCCTKEVPNHARGANVLYAPCTCARAVFCVPPLSYLQSYSKQELMDDDDSESAKSKRDSLEEYNVSYQADLVRTVSCPTHVPLVILVTLVTVNCPTHVPLRRPRAMALELPNTCILGRPRVMALGRLWSSIP